MPWISGLPPVAQQRVDRQRSSRLAGSLLSVGAAVAARSAGFRPIGEVMGCTVMHIGWGGYQCGGYGRSSGIFGGGYGPVPVIVSGDPGPGGGPQPYGLAPQAAAYNQGWDSSLNRMLIEAQALGADGVVGVQLSQQVLDGNNHEFLAIGTAVGDGNPLTPGADRWPFCTELGGQDLANLATAGWLPTGISIGLSIALRHDDYGTLAARSSWSNQEITGYTELLAASRADARRQLWNRARRVGGEHVVVSSMWTTSFERTVSDGHTDHGAHSTFIGTALRRAEPGDLPDEPRAAPRQGLTIMPLTAAPPATRGRR